MKFKHCDDGVAILCGDCSRRFAVLTKKGVRFIAEHGHRPHANTLTPNELETLAEISRALMNGIDLTQKGA